MSGTEFCFQLFDIHFTRGFLKLVVQSRRFNPGTLVGQRWRTCSHHWRFRAWWKSSGGIRTIFAIWRRFYKMTCFTAKRSVKNDQVKRCCWSQVHCLNARRSNPIFSIKAFSLNVLVVSPELASKFGNQFGGNFLFTNLKNSWNRRAAYFQNNWRQKSASWFNIVPNTLGQVCSKHVKNCLTFFN